jgi:hypothetical protein
VHRDLEVIEGSCNRREKDDEMSFALVLAAPLLLILTGTSFASSPAGQQIKQSMEEIRRTA